MTHIIICDYPYHTEKYFFETKEEVCEFVPPPFIKWSINRFLQKRIYELERYGISDKGDVNYKLKEIEGKIRVLNINDLKQITHD